MRRAARSKYGKGPTTSTETMIIMLTVTVTLAKTDLSASKEIDCGASTRRETWDEERKGCRGLIS